MTFLQLNSDLRLAAPRRRIRWNRLFGALGLGAGIGIVVALTLDATKPSFAALLPIGLALLLPSIWLKHFRIYWLAVFLLLTQFLVSKNLNDGLAVINRLQIDYTIWNFTFNVTASDFALAVLIVIWLNDYLFHGLRFRFPAISWLAVGYLLLCCLSIAGSNWPYLGFVESWQQAKLFLAYLYAVNCIKSKIALRLLVIIGVIVLVTQAGVTVMRFETGYMYPFTFGDSYQSSSWIEAYLAVDRSDADSLVRAYGTLGSPGSTVRLCMMVIPFALLLCARNAMFGMRLMFAGLTAFGVLGLTLTFDRVYYITTAVQIGLAFLITIRDRMIKREEAVLVVLVGLALAGFMAPKLYQQFTVREDSVSVRLLQYEAAGRMILDHPFLGVGLNNGTADKPQYVNVTYNKRDPNTQFYLEPTHNVYLSMASEIGIPATLLFCLFFAGATLEAWRQSRGSPDPVVRLGANALVVVFIGVAVNGLMDPFAEYSVVSLLWLYAGISLNLAEMARPDEKPTPVVQPGRRPSLHALDVADDGSQSGRPNSADTVEKVGFEVVGAVRVGGHNSPRDRRDASGSRDRRRHRDQHGELAEVLGGGGEVELVVGTVRSS